MSERYAEYSKLLGVEILLSLYRIMKLISNQFRLIMRNDFRGYTVTSSGIAVSSGIYFYRFETGDFAAKSA